MSVIPHTGEETTLLTRTPGDQVNLENDILGKYIQKLLGKGDKRQVGKESGLTMDFLKQYDF